MPRKRPPATPKPDMPARLPRTRKQLEAENAATMEQMPPPAFFITPPKWEYRVLESEGMDRWYDPRAQLEAMTFNKLGLLGWELVTIYTVADALHAPVYYAVFKREVSTSNAT